MSEERKLLNMSGIDSWFQRRTRKPLGRQAVIRLADDYFKESFHVPDAKYSMSDHYSLGACGINAFNSMIFHRYAVRRFRKETTIIEPSKCDADLDDYVSRRRKEAVDEMYKNIPLGRDRRKKE